MYLKRLELQGFKSFADKTILELRPGITTVIGPNGSGKSNISDAIRWVLGEQSMKSLRGTKSLDIIFAGTQNRKSLGFAEASLVFDNSDGALPIEFTEVTVTRKIYRSGETGYYINKTPCRLKDVLELFMDTGIGKDGYSIIGQGKIDEILSNKSEDRRHIFEEAAGIVKYRSRKEEAEKKLEHTKLNLLRINDIISEIEGNLGPLQTQSEKAKKYLNLREELKNIEVGLFVYNIEKYKEKMEEKLKEHNFEEQDYKYLIKCDLSLNNSVYENQEKNGLKDLENQGKGYTILETDKIGNIAPPTEYNQPGGTTIVKLYASKLLAVNETGVVLDNHAEIIETFKKIISPFDFSSTTPGNHNPSTGTPDECDDGEVRLVITPPTGISQHTVNTNIILISSTVVLIIIAVGICLIKKNKKN